MPSDDRCPHDHCELPPPAPSLSPARYAEGGTDEFVCEGSRVVHNDGATSVGANRFSARIVATVVLADGWFFVTDDGAVMRSETFLGAAHMTARLPCGFYVNPRGSGRLAALDASGRLLLLASHGVLVQAPLDGPALDAVFADDRFGAAVMHDGRLFFTANGGASWQRFDLGDDLASHVGIERAGLSVDTLRGHRMVTLRRGGVLALAPPSSPPTPLLSSSLGSAPIEASDAPPVAVSPRHCEPPASETIELPHALWRYHCRHTGLPRDAAPRGGGFGEIEADVTPLTPTITRPGGAAVLLTHMHGGPHRFGTDFILGETVAIGDDGRVVARRGFLGPLGWGVSSLIGRRGELVGPVFQTRPGYARLELRPMDGRPPIPLPEVHLDRLVACAERTTPDFVLGASDIPVDLIDDTRSNLNFALGLRAEIELHGTHACIRSLRGTLHAGVPFTITARPDGDFDGDLLCQRTRNDAP